MKPLKFYGVYKDYIWGGSKMRQKYNVEADVSPLAESWVLSCHPDGESVISGGEFDGMPLGDFIKNNPSVLGTSCKTDELPILIKFIDAADRLSVQVHPNDEQAKEWENQNGKTEMWYVIDADGDAEITYGVKENITSQELCEAIKNNTVCDLLKTEKSHKGDVYFVEAGTIHAIGKGNLIAEIQQNSNITYRLYDYDRRGKDGKPRELHVEKGVKASLTEKTQPRSTPLCSDGTRLIGSCEYFNVKEVILDEADRCFTADDSSYHALVQTDGESIMKYGDESVSVKAGEVLFIPAGLGDYTLSGNGVVLLTSNAPRFYVGIDLGGTNIAAAVVDEYGVIYGRATRKTKAPRPYNEIFDDMALCAMDAAGDSGISFEAIESVGIGCPGAINIETGSVDFSNNLDFYDVPIVQYMENKLNKKIYIENDANAAAWGEFVAGSGKDTGSMIMLTLGTGVGSGIISDGHLFRGSFGTGAELGHMVIHSGGEKCTCGRNGCLEAYASATALIGQAKKAMNANLGCEMWKLVGNDIDRVNGKTVFTANDDVALQVVDTYLGYLSEGIVNIVNMFQPEVICLGGGVSGAGERILNPIREAIRDKAFARFGKKHTRMKIASLGNDAGIIGAALLWKNNY